MGEKNTKERLLAAAEHLFARHGFHSTSLRAVTGRAGVNLAAVNYHFGSKEALIRAVIEKRLLPLNQERLERLREVRRKAAGRPAAREALSAFVEPAFQFSQSGAGARDFITIIGRSLSEADATVRTIFLELVAPVFRLLYEVLGEALPDLPGDVLFWRLHFTVGAMGHAVQMSQDCPFCPSGIKAAKTAEELNGLFLDFVTSGMQAEP